MSSILCLGVDPGLANTGIAAVERHPDGTYTSRGVRVSRTKPDNTKTHRARKGEDDQRRYKEHFQHLWNAAQALKPQCIAVEAYTTYEPSSVGDLRSAAGDLIGLLGTSAPSQDEVARVLSDPRWLARFTEGLVRVGHTLQQQHAGIGLGQAAKTIAVFGMVLTIGFTINVPVFVFQPSDLKKRFGGRSGASKEEVCAGLERLVAGFSAQLAEKVPQKTLKEHAGDSCGHAVLGADAFAEFAHT